jgi:hypothetical protein
MFHVVKDLEKLKVIANDGEVGFIYDLLFDDQKWTIRYLVIDTGNWLSGRKVLISPVSVKEIDLQNKSCVINLNKNVIEGSPELTDKKPISQQFEKELIGYYNLPVYWTVDPSLRVRGDLDSQQNNDKNSHENQHLRSVREVRDYNIQANDGDAGYIHSFLLATINWEIKFLVLDKQKLLRWIPGGRYILISPEWITEIKWNEKKAYLELKKADLEKSPDYTPGQGSF